MSLTFSQVDWQKGFVGEWFRFKEFYESGSEGFVVFFKPNANASIRETPSYAPGPTGPNICINRI